MGRADSTTLALAAAEVLAISASATAANEMLDALVVSQRSNPEFAAILATGRGRMATCVKNEHDKKGRA